MVPGIAFLCFAETGPLRRRGNDPVAVTPQAQIVREIGRKIEYAASRIRADMGGFV